MSTPATIHKTIPIDPAFFCDGHYAVLLSHSLGGSGMEPHALADRLSSGTAESMHDLLRRGICLPIFFGGDGALDGATLFVLGALEERHAQAWIGRLTSKLSIPCGKLVLLAGGGDGDELAQAVSGQPPREHYCIYQSIDVPPGDYRVDVLAYVDSMTVAFMAEDLDDDALREKYQHLPSVSESYVVHLTPWVEELPLPALSDQVDWPGVFTFR